MDENDDYVLIPDYYNDGDDTIALTNADDAGACEIRLDFMEW